MTQPTLTRGLPLLLTNCLLLIVTTACGGGSASDASQTPTLPSIPQTPPPTPPPTTAQLEVAARFSSQATFGLKFEDIEALAQIGNEAWFDAQVALPAGFHTPLIDELMARRDAGEFASVDPEDNYPLVFRRLAWWHQSLSAEDVLRQRVAFALSEILVTSDQVDTLLVFPYALGTYYDVLLTHALGNYRDLLLDVSLNPAMGVYLSHLNNVRGDPAQNRFPDENYAREVMQLFSVGLYELNPDGTRKTTADGAPIPTYNNQDIQGLARVFTGLTFANASDAFPIDTPDFKSPMQMVEFAHEPGEKRLIGGVILPAGQPGMQDIEQAVDVLFEHPNVGPFIGRQLIQRLVTSNPSPAYVARVAAAFADNGSGQRGDMSAVIRAILFDQEARAAPVQNGSFGKLREPVERLVGLMRQLNVESDGDRLYHDGYFLQFLTAQHPLSAFSVFNFFAPDHQPNGELLDLNLLAPEFQITTSTTIVGMSNLVDAAVSSDIFGAPVPPFEPLRLNLSDLLALAAEPEALVERLDLLLTSGSLSPATRDAINVTLAELDGLNNAELVLRTALYLILVSPDYSVRI